VVVVDGDRVVVGSGAVVVVDGDRVVVGSGAVVGGGLGLVSERYSW